MLGFYSAKTAKVLFGDNLVHKLSSTLFVGGVIIFSLSSLLSLGIIEFNLDETHYVARCLVGAFLVVLASLIAANAGFNIVKNHTSPYSLLPLLITPIAFMLFGIDLILEPVLLETVYATLYAVGLFINCFLCLYALLIVRKSKRLISFFLVFQFSLAIALLLLIHHDRLLTISLILWFSLLKFSLSSIVGSRLIQSERLLGNRGSNNSYKNRHLIKVPRHEQERSPKARIYIWLPENEMDTRNMTIPWIGKYFFAYSFQQNNLMVGHVAVSTDEFYASIYPNKESFSQKFSPAVSRKQIGRRHRMFHPGYWANFQQDLSKRGSDYVEIDVDIYDSESLSGAWDRMKGFTDYSLYWRNCAVVSIQLFEACICQSLSALPFTKTLLRVYSSAHFWSAVIAKQRSEMFVWSPGLAYDYINNLQQLVAKLNR